MCHGGISSQDAVLTVGAFPATPALASVTAVLQDTGAFIHAWARFAEADWPLGFSA